MSRKRQLDGHNDPLPVSWQGASCAAQAAGDDEDPGHEERSIMKKKAIESDGVKQRSAVEDDVEGHAFKLMAAEGDGVKQRSAVEDDVEGHAFKLMAAEGDGVKQRSAVEDDVEGHNIGSLSSMLLAGELARAKERDVQRAVSRANLLSEAKRALKHKR
jgi:hypothetical protein